MDITILHKSILNDCIDYENYAHDCGDDCVLPGSLAFIEEATKYDFTLTYDGTKSLKSFVEEDIRDHIQVDNRFEVSYAQYLIEQERELGYNFIDDKAYQTLEAAIDLIEDLDYHYSHVWFEEDTSEIDYQAILTTVNEYQTKIKKLVEETYQLSVLPYIEKYHQLFDPFDNPDNSKVVNLLAEDWNKPNESESINVIYSDNGCLPKSLDAMQELAEDTSWWCLTQNAEDYRQDYYTAQDDVEQAFKTGIPRLKSTVSDIIATIKQEEQQGFNTVQVTIKEKLKKLERYLSTTIAYYFDKLRIVKRNDDPTEWCENIAYHLSVAYEFYIDVCNHAIKLYSTKYKELFSEELNEVEPVEFDYDEWYLSYCN